MERRLPHSVTLSQPHLVAESAYRAGMGRNSKIILRDNVRRLLKLKDIESGVGKLVDLGIPNGTVQRVLARP